MFSNDFTILYISTAIFILAVLHIFLTKKILHLAHYFQKKLVLSNLLHFLGEVEVVFGFWAFILIILIASLRGIDSSVNYLDSLNFTEAAFVFVIMCMSATRPIISFSTSCIQFFAHILPFHKRFSFYLITLILGPLLGSLITEPAAMTVVALLLKKEFYDKSMSRKFMYATLGLLFVNISIGGTLTNFAAPPVLMVSKAWDWSTPYMLQHFGWKSAISIVIGTFLTAFFFRKDITQQDISKNKNTSPTPPWLIISHIFFILLCVLYHKYIAFFIALFLLFIGWHKVTKHYQEELKIRETLLVGFFLAGLVALGSLQGWWLKPLLFGLNDTVLFFSSLVLTAFIDNAALTYLGTLVPNLSEAAKQALVGGAVIGGGLTVIANAPNPAGFGILNKSFGNEGISPLGLFLGALPYTVLAVVVFLL